MIPIALAIVLLAIAICELPRRQRSAPVPPPLPPSSSFPSFPSVKSVPSSALKTNLIPWRLPPDATNYWWDLYQSCDLKHWSLLAQGITGDVEVRPCCPTFYRLQARP